MRGGICILFLSLLIGACHGGGGAADQDAASSGRWLVPTVPEETLITRLSPHLRTPEQDSFRLNYLIDFVIEQTWDMHIDPAGIFYHILDPGAQPMTKWGDKVSVHYRGFLLDGTQFDSSISRGKPFSFYVGNVIAGWNAAMPHLGMGGRGIFVIPSNLAYGAEGFGDMVPPNEHLIFEIHLIENRPAE